MQQEEGRDRIGIAAAFHAVFRGIIGLKALGDKDQHGVVAVEVPGFDDDEFLCAGTQRKGQAQEGQEDFFHIPEILRTFTNCTVFAKL